MQIIIIEIQVLKLEWQIRVIFRAAATGILFLAYLIQVSISFLSSILIRADFGFRIGAKASLQPRSIKPGIASLANFL